MSGTRSYLAWIAPSKAESQHQWATSWVCGSHKGACFQGKSALPSGIRKQVRSQYGPWRMLLRKLLKERMGHENPRKKCQINSKITIS